MSEPMTSHDKALEAAKSAWHECCLKFANTDTCIRAAITAYHAALEGRGEGVELGARQILARLRGAEGVAERADHKVTAAACHDASELIATLLTRLAELERERDGLLKGEMLGEENAPEYPSPPDGWVCYHCGVRFHAPGAARLHFGEKPGDPPLCISKLQAALSTKAAEAERLRAALTKVREELWVDYCLGKNTSRPDPKPFETRPVVSIIDRALASTGESR